mgnify:CR=1 FL=1
MKGKKQGMRDMERLHYLLNANFSNSGKCLVVNYSKDHAPRDMADRERETITEVQR